MEVIYQLLNDKKYRMLLYITFAVSIIFTFVFSTYMLLANVNTTTDRYNEERIRNERLHGNKTANHRQEIVDSH